MTSSVAVFQAVESCQQWRLQYFLDNGICINGRNERGENVLLSALRIRDPKGRQRMFEWLLKLGVSPHSVDKVCGRNVLHWAAFLDRPNELKTLLLEKDGELNLTSRDNRGLTALHYGVVNGSAVVVSMLTGQIKKYGLSVDVPDRDGFTPYLLATRLGCRDCARILRCEGGSSPKQCDSSFRTAEEWAELGLTERDHQQREEQNRQIGVYKIFGRLPQLMAASYETDRIRIALLSRNERLALGGVSRSGLESRNGSPCVTSRTSVTHELASPIPKREQTLPSITSSRKSAQPSFHRNQELASSPVTFKGEQSIRRSLPRLMDLASEKFTDSYRTAAVKPPQYADTGTESRSSISFCTAAKVSALAMRLKRKAQRRASCLPRTSRAGEGPKRMSLAGQGKLLLGK